MDQDRAYMYTSCVTPTFSATRAYRPRTARIGACNPPAQVQVDPYDSAEKRDRSQAEHPAPV